MLKVNMTLKVSETCDQKKIASLCDLVFGPGRFAKTAFRIREAYKGNEDFGLCMLSGNEFVGSITFTPIKISNHKGAYLLGPLVVHPGFAGLGGGSALIESGLEQVQARSGKLVILIGDLMYYKRMGFIKAPKERFSFPGPVDKDRILFRELVPGAIDKFQGNIMA